MQDKNYEHLQFQCEVAIDISLNWLLVDRIFPELLQSI
jgi:hypothetical protein